ncbi:DUF2807 domain-containing protein [Flaviaesturariibacter flavus]|uniref:DUF2807 domain-containing protein n=1 Tax=Flaviaesturariibacter flavus TaxID=2502780 RepID=A0A4R1BJZ6_9BACT|nr:head GIN domain-containing protein [Flaviaesturariibacter flavus]TCJ17528.1 DUF2807 domain-containing protein [Flaviaesturariibacter flavus]
MKQTIYLTTVFLLVLAAASCSRPGCAQKAGAPTRTVRGAEPFSHIVVSDNINLVLRQESTWRIEVETDENLQAAVSTEVANGVLSIRNTASCAWIRRPGETINVSVSLPDLNRLEYQGSGTVSCADTLHLDYLSVEADHGAGTVNLLLDTRFTSALINNEVTDFVFAGRSDSCYTWCSSRGAVDYRNFRVQRLALDFAGVRDARVWATESLRATIFQNGNIYFRGTPALFTDYRGSGRLIATP